MAEKQWQGGTAPLVDDLGDGSHVPVFKLTGGASAVPVSMSETNWATTFTRNGPGQITQESRTDGSVTQSRSYTYDAAGNLTGIGAWA